MDPKEIRLDILETLPDVDEWFAENWPDVKTVGDLAAKCQPGDQMPEEISENVCWALGYYVWYKLHHGRAPGE